MGYTQCVRARITVTFPSKTTYIPSQLRPCFIINTPSSQIAKQFALKPTCKGFIVHNIGRNTISQPAQCLQGTEQCVMTKAKTPTQKPYPKWITVNNIDLYTSAKEVIIGNEWLNDQHMHVAQTLIKEQYPYINGLMTTILQGRNPLPKHSLQILHRW